MGTFIKLFIVGVIVIVMFKVAVALLPYVLIGFLFLYLVDYFKKKKRSQKESKLNCTPKSGQG